MRFQADIGDTARFATKLPNLEICLIPRFPFKDIFRFRVNKFQHPITFSAFLISVGVVVLTCLCVGLFEKE